MGSKDGRIRVLYSFPHKIGAQRICSVAWQQVKGLAAAGADVVAFPGAIHKALPPNVNVRPTLARGNLRIPYKLLGTFRSCALHDWIVSRRIEEMTGRIDIIHTWPVGALRTLRTAARMGIPTVLERPNAHSEFAYQVVQRECDTLGIKMPAGHEHAYHADVLRKENAEYQLADRLLCPSDFVVHTFLEKGFPPDKLARHQYGFDQTLYYPDREPRTPMRGLCMAFVAGCAPRKGLHYALEAWLDSPAHRDGTFLVVGDFIPGYAEKLAPMLAHPSVHRLGFRKDLPELLRKTDILVLPSVEEGSSLVTSEARGSGCVLLVSEAAGAICKHMENALVHPVGDIRTLAQHITMLHEDRGLLETLRLNSLNSLHEITWTAAGERLLNVYREVIAAGRGEESSVLPVVVRPRLEELQNK